ncbi:MAG: ABC transporter substrate binding protein [Deltaproteobacteria bacterium]
MKVFVITLLFILCCGLAEAGQEIIAVQSVRVAPYEEALKGFKSTCDARIRRIIISEKQETDIPRKIKRIKPDIVVAIGKDALLTVKKIKNIPIVYLMVLNPQSMLSGEKNITGVSMNISPEKQLRALLGVLPKTKRIGLVYDPRRTASLVEDAQHAAHAQHAARKMGVTLLVKKAESSKEVPSLSVDMKGKIDAFWMVPDITVITPDTVEFLILFSMENNIPLLTFSEKYLELGAFMSTAIDPFDMGVQAAEMANNLLREKDGKSIQQADARKMIVSTNLMIAGKLGVHLNLAWALETASGEKIIRKSQIIN